MPQFFDAQPPMLPLALAAALIACAVSFSVDVDAEALGQRPDGRGARPPAVWNMPFEAPTLAPSAIVIHSAPAFRAEEGMVKIFFAPSKTNVAASAESALSAIALAAKRGQRVQIAGFHDETGNPQVNHLLAKQRAHAIQQCLLSLGVPAHAMVLKKPAVAVAAASHAEARRVEVVLIQ